MSEIGGVASGQPRAYIERVERLEEEKAALVADVRDVYAEAKGAGFDVKIMRQVVRLRKLDADDRAEQAALLELYMRAVHGWEGTPLGQTKATAEARGCAHGRGPGRADLARHGQTPARGTRSGSHVMSAAPLFTIDARDFALAAKFTMVEGIHPLIQGVHVIPDGAGGAMLAATDGTRLAIFHQPAGGALAAPDAAWTLAVGQPNSEARVFWRLCLTRNLRSLAATADPDPAVDDLVVDVFAPPGRADAVLNASLRVRVHLAGDRAARPSLLRIDASIAPLLAPNVAAIAKTVRANARPAPALGYRLDPDLIRTFGEVEVRRSALARRGEAGAAPLDLIACGSPHDPVQVTSQRHPRFFGLLMPMTGAATAQRRERPRRKTPPDLRPDWLPPSWRGKRPAAETGDAPEATP